MNEDWKKNIVSMIYVKQELLKLDVKKIWPHNFPNIAATEEQIKIVEDKLGYKLDSNYRSFLKYANGWKGFMQTIDLFGTYEILNSSIMNYATDMLNIIDQTVFDSSGLNKKELLPIAATMEDKDIFVITSPNSFLPGQVIWFAGEEIDRFTDFTEFYFSMIEYNKIEIKRMKQE